MPHLCILGEEGDEGVAPDGPFSQPGRSTRSEVGMGAGCRVKESLRQ